MNNQQMESAASQAPRLFLSCFVTKKEIDCSTEIAQFNHGLELRSGNQMTNLIQIRFVHCFYRAETVFVSFCLLGWAEITLLFSPHMF